MYVVSASPGNLHSVLIDKTNLKFSGTSASFTVVPNMHKAEGEPVKGREAAILGDEVS